MKRKTTAPRDNWQETVESQGLTYAMDYSQDQTGRPYWNESEYYEFEEPEVDYLEKVTDELHEMSVAACAEMLKSNDVMSKLRIPFASEQLVAESLANTDAISLYGRFDLAWDGTGDAKLLEYNADTPAALVEAAVVQWFWLEDKFPDKDQWNMVHERLVQAWRKYAPNIPEGIVHFAAGNDEPTEDWATIAYLRDTASEAGLHDVGTTMEEIGWDSDTSQFVDGENSVINTIFKMYPWDWILNEEFGRVLPQATTQWIEPAWKLLAGSKALLVKLWEMYPDHPNLLPAYFEPPETMKEYVAKPILGWEGAGIRIVANDINVSNEATHTAGQHDVYQQYVPLPRFNEKYVILGTWVINGHASGLGVRQSSSPITDTHGEFVPHIINSPRSSPEQIDSWLEQSS